MVHDGLGRENQCSLPHSYSRLAFLLAWRQKRCVKQLGAKVTWATHIKTLNQKPEQRPPAFTCLRDCPPPSGNSELLVGPVRFFFTGREKVKNNYYGVWGENQESDRPPLCKAGETTKTIVRKKISQRSTKKAIIRAEIACT